MKRTIYLLFVALIAMSACHSGKKSAQNNLSGNPDPAHTSENALDWAGVYKGLLPCADCQGIQVEIRLNDDLTYERVMTYMGKGDNRYADKGRFEWDVNGRRIKLTPDSADNDGNTWFQVGENQLIVLDTAGNRIESNLPPGTYNFKKIDLDNVVTEKYWKLIELDGKAIASNEEGAAREAHFILHAQNSLISGSTGCNRLTGKYDLDEQDGRIGFSPLATTRMACIGVDYEQSYLDVFGATDNYTVSHDTLSLNNADNEALAKFVAVYLR